MYHTAWSFSVLNSHRGSLSVFRESEWTYWNISIVMKEISLCHCRLKLHGPVGNKLLLFRLMRASRKADAEYSNDHYNWLQWKRLLFKYISECTVNWAKVQLCLCSETASGFILSGRLCSLNLGFISVAECSRYLWLLFVREDAKPGRSGCFNTGSSWIVR